MARKSISDLIPDDLGSEPAIPEPLRRRTVPQPAEPEPALVVAPQVPAPYASESDGALGPKETADLAVCEAAIDTLRLAFWAAGKALQVIRDARLYRGTHPTFEAYCEDRWQMRRAHADRLIRSWPLAERLNPIGSKDLNEGQVRELVPLQARHGLQAAVTVYQTIADADVKVTAALLKEVVGVLPEDRFDADEAVEQITAYLGQRPDAPPSAAHASATVTFTAEAERLRMILRRVMTRDTLRAAAAEDPDQVRAVVSELRELLDEAEREL